MQYAQRKIHDSARTVEVGVLDGDDACLGEDLLGEVVDQLSVDEARDACVCQRRICDEYRQVKSV